ncbi:ferritin heavy chain-like [Phymastichus coffea]|uniref:ferritin heavy chain-like n=1 Tax=Phymastichus coffea TaxID=108790 RepID=UPI00273B660A|nr:ferritin heavy chain-like [Phymastichus coffea]XP_058807319.1 ferritin heavy chain-like [Phymastichus coffea]
MKFVQAFVLAAVCIGFSAADNLKCTIKPAEVPQAWRDMVNPCIRIMENQVKVEIEAAMTYLAMSAHFARDIVNRPGFSKMFLESANEEREHAIKIIEYLLMRGQLTSDVSKLLKFPLKPIREEWNSGVEALTDALNLESQVTRNIREIIMTCESPKDIPFNDYHLVDYLTGDFLEEQYKGQRDLAGKISTLGKMMASHGALGEFLFDKKLLNNEI